MTRFLRGPIIVFELEPRFLARVALAFVVFGSLSGAGLAQPAVSIVASDGAAIEGSDTGEFTITRPGVLPLTSLEVHFSVSGTAGNGTDYTQILSPVTILALETTATIDVLPIDDNDVEGNKTVVVTLMDDPEGDYTIGDPATATVTIADDDFREVSVVATDASASEDGPDPGTFTVFRTGDTSDPLTVLFSVSGTAADGTDYVSIGTSVVIPAMATMAEIDVLPDDDGLFEGNETVVVTLTADAAYFIDAGAASAEITITDNDPPPLPEVSIVATDSNASEEGPSPGTFTIFRTGPTTGDLMVVFAVGGSATDPSDYTFAGASSPFVVTIPNGSASATLTVHPVDDSVPGEGGETVIVTLQSNAAYTVNGASSAAVIGITDNDVLLSEVSVVATDPSANEDGDTGRFTVSRTGPTSNPLEVRFAVSGTANAPADYALAGTSSPGVLMIPAGMATSTLTVLPVDDMVPGEGGETVIVTLEPNAAYTIDAGAGAALVTIADKSVLPEVSVVATDPAASEAGGTGTFTFERTGGFGSPLTVSYSVTGSATPGSDYAALPGTIFFGAGMITATVTVTPVQDAVAEGEESVVVSVDPGAGYAVGSPSSATVTIGGQVLPDLEITGPGSGAAGSSVSLTLSPAAPVQEPITGTWRFEFAPDPAIPGNRQVDDRIALSTYSFSIPAGTTAGSAMNVTLGTVAGTVSVFAEVDGSTVREHQIQVEPGPPRVTGAQIVTQSYGFDVVVFGFSPRLDVAAATFVFSGPNVQQPGPVDVAAAFRGWFESPESAAAGTMFEYTQPFNIDGNRSALTSVTVTLTGANGSSAPVSAPIP